MAIAKELFNAYQKSELPFEGGYINAGAAMMWVITSDVVLGSTVSAATANFRGKFTAAPGLAIQLRYISPLQDRAFLIGSLVVLVVLISAYAFEHGPETLRQWADAQIRGAGAPGILMFMAVGTVMYVTGKGRLSKLGGLFAGMPLVFVLYMVGGLSISGVPLFNGFPGYPDQPFRKAEGLQRDP